MGKPTARLLHKEGGPKRDRLIFGSQNHRLENLKTQSILFSINLIENIINAISHCQSAAQL